MFPCLNFAQNVFGLHDFASVSKVLQTVEVSCALLKTVVISVINAGLSVLQPWANLELFNVIQLYAVVMLSSILSCATYSGLAKLCCGIPKSTEPGILIWDWIEFPVFPALGNGGIVSSASAVPKKSRQVSSTKIVLLQSIAVIRNSLVFKHFAGFEAFGYEK